MNKIENVIKDSKNEIFDIDYQFRIGSIQNEIMIELITEEIENCAKEIFSIINDITPGYRDSRFPENAGFNEAVLIMKQNRIKLMEDTE